MKEYITYQDKEKLKISLSTLIFNVASINSKYGRLSEFVKQFELYGVTNGKLYFLSEMTDPPCYLYSLLEKRLAIFNFKNKLDYVFAYEQLTHGVDRIDALASESNINKPIPECEDVEWLESWICEDGNFIWFKDSGESNNSKNNQSESYIKWVKELYSKRQMTYYYELFIEYFIIPKIKF